MAQVRVGIVGAGVIAHRHAGVLAGFPDVELRAVADPALRRRLGAALRHTVETRYSATVLTRVWERLFDEVLAER